MQKIRFTIIFVICACVLPFAGCSSTGPALIDPNAAVAGSMDSLRQLRSINERSRGILEESERFLDDLAGQLERGAVDFRTALRRYDEFVLYLIGRIEELEKLSSGLDEEVLSGADSAYHSVLALRDQYIGEGRLLDFIEKRGSGS